MSYEPISAQLRGYAVNPLGQTNGLPLGLTVADAIELQLVNSKGYIQHCVQITENYIADPDNMKFVVAWLNEQISRIQAAAYYKGQASIRDQINQILNPQE